MLGSVLQECYVSLDPLLTPNPFVMSQEAHVFYQIFWSQLLSFSIKQTKTKHFLWEAVNSGLKPPFLWAWEEVWWMEC